MSEKLFITRKRKKYKFAKFDEFDNCFQFDEWLSFDFSSKPEVIIEIGAGTGLFCVEYAKRYPEKFFIAVDIKSDRLYTGAKLAGELGLDNIIFIRSDVAKFLQVLPENSVSGIWITFPDPYASEDQARLTSTGDRKRLTANKFLNYYKKILKTKGSINFKTDNKPLFDWTARQLENNDWNIKQKSNDLHNSEIDDDKKIMTTYEERFVYEDLPILFLSATIK